jgi:TonB-linked SusC/RagA family outer membrane protein
VAFIISQQSSPGAVEMGVASTAFRPKLCRVMTQRYQWCAVFLVAALVAALAAPSAFAQSVEGSVVEAKTGEPIPGANIQVKGTTIGTTTDTDGRFEINIESETATLVVSFIGFRSQEVDVSAGDSDVRVELSEDVVGLEEVVVTGLASGTRRENIANSIETVSAADLTGATSVETLDGALAGKVTGAQISSYSGAPGGGMSVKLRGVSTINGNSQPLYIVDGIIASNESIQTNVNAVTAAAAGGNRSSQDNPVNRIADLNPRDIESIEILKGPSAAAIYGGRASNGVVIITTKKGRNGDTQINFSQALGVTTIRNTVGMRQFTEATALEVYAPTVPDINDPDVTQDDVDMAIAERERIRGIYQDGESKGFIDYEELIFGQESLLARTSLSASGGGENTQFFVSGLYQNDGGIVDRTGYDKRAARVNLTHFFTEDLSLTTTGYYANTVTRRGLTGNDNTGTTYGISLLTTPNFVDIRRREDGTFPRHPFAIPNALQTIALITNEETVNRYMAGGDLSYNALRTDTQSLRFVLQGGLDTFDYENVGLFPRELFFEQLADPDGVGTSILGRTRVINTNFRALAVHSYSLDSGLQFRTQAGVTSFNKTLNFNNSVAEELISGQQNIDFGATLRTNQEREFETTRSFFVQEEVNYDNRVILTGSVRGDRSSLVGDVDKFYLYPRAALAVNLTNFDFWGYDQIGQLKLRGAYGQTGNTPGFGRKYTSFSSTTIGGTAGTLVDLERGAAAVLPERQTEIELGFDLAAFEDRASLEFTVYQKRITDQILQREVPASTGFRTETFNGGTLVNRGLEASLSLIPVERDAFRWRSRTNFWTNQAEVESLPVPAFRALGGGFGISLGEVRIEEGQSPTQIVGIDDQATQYQNDSGEWITLDAGTPDGATDVNPDGSQIVYRLGDVAPDFEMSFDNRFEFGGGFSLAVLAHLKVGADNLNLSELLYDLNQTSPDYDDRITFTRNIRNPDGTPIETEFSGNDNFAVVGSCPTTNPNDATDFATCTFETRAGDFRRTQQFGVSASQFVQSATYFRIREVGLYYSVPQNFLSRFSNGVVRSVRVGVSANDVFTATPYKSYDPDVNNFGAQPVATGVEVTPYPSSKRFFFHLDVGF